MNENELLTMPANELKVKGMKVKLRPKEIHGFQLSASVSVAELALCVVNKQQRRRRRLHVLDPIFFFICSFLSFHSFHFRRCVHLIKTIIHFSFENGLL